LRAAEGSANTWYPLPPKCSRRHQTLRDTAVDAAFDFGTLAELTEGYSGSDIKELCREVAMSVAMESFEPGSSGTANRSDGSAPVRIRPLTLQDFVVAQASKTRKAYETNMRNNRARAR